MFQNKNQIALLKKLGLLVLMLLIGLGAWYGYTRITTLSNQINNLENELAQTIEMLQANISQTRAGLTEALSEEQRTVASIQEQLGGFQQTVGNISGSVSTLEKLSNTDPQLLQKYSRVFFLNEHYHPPRLEEIPSQYKLSTDRTLRFHAQAWPYLEDLLKAAKRDGLELFAASGFRSFNEQSNIKQNYVTTYGAGTANQFSADQGYSEHQLGTAIDFTTKELGGGLSGFSNTEAYTWLQKNAHRFGFVLSYPENNDYYIFEPWHWRFVGVKLATDLNRAGDYFYDWDQRRIDEYIINLFD